MTLSYAAEASPETAVAAAGIDAQPAWVADELPAEYTEIASKIAALKEQALRFERVAGAMWQTGPPLTAAVRDLFSALQYTVEEAPSGANYDLLVDLENGRRLLVHVIANGEPIDRRSPYITRVLKALQEDAGDHDRVVIAANIFPGLPLPARRQDPVTLDAIRLIQGLGANFVPTSALFGVWRSSLQDLPQARKSVIKLYSMDGGIFR